MYPVRREGILIGITRWPNDQNHPQIDKSSQEYADFIAAQAVEKTSLAEAILAELEPRNPGFANAAKGRQ